MEKDWSGRCQRPSNTATAVTAVDDNYDKTLVWTGLCQRPSNTATAVTAAADDYDKSTGLDGVRDQVTLPQLLLLLMMIMIKALVWTVSETK